MKTWHYVCPNHAPRGGKFLGKDPTEFVGLHVKLDFLGKSPSGKMCHEHMWVRIDSMADDGTLTGMLDNDPTYDHGDLECGSEISGIQVLAIEDVLAPSPTAAPAASATIDAKKAQSITLQDFLTNDQLKECLKLAGLSLSSQGEIRRTGGGLSDGDYTKAVREKIIEPNIAEVNAKIKALFKSRGLSREDEDNDPSFLAYMVTYVVLLLRTS